MGLDRVIWTAYRMYQDPIDVEQAEIFEVLKATYGNAELDEFFDEDDLSGGRVNMDFLKETVNGVNTILNEEDC